VVANVARLRAVYNDHLIPLGRLDDALAHRVDDDTLYARRRRDSPALQPSATKAFGAIRRVSPASPGATAPGLVAPPVDETAPSICDIIESNHNHHHASWPGKPVKTAMSRN
jgi:hypothetical protein